MPTTVNIAGTSPVDDPSYRYKMPLVYGKVEGRGNGIKTVVPNISDLALSLHRDAGEVNKFFGCELGAQTTYAEATDRAVVNGSHADAALQEMVHKYIEGFVLCPECGLPETHYKFREGCIFHKCAACGATKMINMEHKLCTYILAQHKKQKKIDKKNKKEGKDKDGNLKEGDDAKKKKSKKDGKDKDKDKDSDEAKAKKKKKKEKKKAKKDKKEEKSDTDKLADDMDEISIGSDVGVDDAGAIALAVQGVQTYIKNNPNATATEVAETVVNQQMSSAVKSHDKIHILLRAVLTPSFYRDKEIPKYAPYIEKITLGNPIMERHLVGAAEYICVERPKSFPVMLKLLYDEGCLEEEIILEWAFDGRTGYTCDEVDEEVRSQLRGEAEPFIAWLQEEDDSSGSDDE